MMEVNKRELVCSVAVITYNHEAYVKECIESILDQNLNCELEVIIADDHSTDNTVKVIEEVLKSHQRSSCVKLLVQPKNIGMTNNFTFSLSQCTGKYIALLEGDDYWTDKFKLQKQVDFLESNPDCVACHHWHEYAVKKNGTYVSVPAPTENVGYCTQEKTTIEDIFANKVRIKTRTHTFRNVIGEMPKWFNTIAYGDVAVSMILGQYGKFGFINEPMAVYRITGEGVSAN